MDDFSLHVIGIIIWAVVGALIIARSASRSMPTVGLSMAFMAVLSLEHWFGAVIYALPWFDGYEQQVVMLGFRYSVLAVAAFGFGNLMFTPFLVKNFHFSWLKIKPHIPDSRLPKVYLVTGFLFYFALNPILSKIPSIRTLAYSGWSLIIVALCLGCWNAWRLKKGKNMFLWLMIAAFAPIFTMINSGFLILGVTALMTVVCFISVFFRPKWIFILLTTVTAYLALSFFVTYMEYRGELRALVWGQEDWRKRMNLAEDMAKDFKYMNFTDNAQLSHIDMRLNQSRLTGLAIDNIQNGHASFALGETLRDSVFAMVPRIIWPAKPIEVNPMEILNKYTEEDFDQETTVGMGLIMELYINFSIWGIGIGFFLFGMIMALIDTAAAHRLLNGDWQGFVYWFLPALALVGCTSFVQISMTAVASVVFCHVVNKFVLKHIGVERMHR